MSSSNNIGLKNFDHAAKLMDCIRYLLNNELNSDVQFHFKNDVVLYGHKFIIGLRSSVFNTMFYGHLSMAASTTANDQNVCKIEDISATSFFEMLKFIYRDEVNICEKNFAEVMYAAHKYSIHHLEKICCNFVKQKLNSENCCSYLQQCFLYNNDLSKKCLEVIDKDIRLIIEKNTWKDLDEAQMMAILRRDTLEIGESTLFDGVMAWAKHSCEKQGIDIKAINVREKFSLFELVRFPIMSLVEFSLFHRSNKYFLRKEEIADIFQFINAGIVSVSMRHSTVKRKSRISSRIRTHQSKAARRITYPTNDDVCFVQL